MIDVATIVTNGLLGGGALRGIMVNRIPAILGGSPLYAMVAFVGACEVALMRGAVGPAGAGHGSFYCDLPGHGYFGAVAPLAAAEAPLTQEMRVIDEETARAHCEGLA